ncbi:MAG: hypothetical protein ACT4P4_03400 [Betaproteobacteria bacterium]
MNRIRVQRARRRAADDRSRREDSILDFLALGLSSRLSVFGRGADSVCRPISRRQLAHGRFAGGGARFMLENGEAFTDLKVSKAELVDLCSVSPSLDRRRALT